MLFPTLTFAVFFMLVYPIYWFLRERGGMSWKPFILGASYIFYGFWDWRFVFLIIASTIINQWLAVWIDPPGYRLRKPLMAVAVAFNLGLLGVFKYYGFFIDSFNTALRRLGLGTRLPVLEIIVPVGISFFTFQAITYVVDTTKGRSSPPRCSISPSISPSSPISSPGRSCARRSSSRSCGDRRRWTGSRRAARPG